MSWFDRLKAVAILDIGERQYELKSDLTFVAVEIGRDLGRVLTLPCRE